MPRKERIQVLLNQEELERFRGHAGAAGIALSRWLREAALKQADELDHRERLDSREALQAFFARCDALDDGAGDEPDWDDVKRRLADGKTSGLQGPTAGSAGDDGHLID
jgi:hypothetical protein